MDSHEIERLLTHVAERFEIDERFAEVEGRLDRIEQRLDKLESRMERVEAKVDGILERLDMLTTWLMRHVQAAEAKFLDHEGRIVAIEQRFGPLPQPAL